MAMVKLLRALKFLIVLCMAVVDIVSFFVMSDDAMVKLLLVL